ncbi:MAG: FliM/FliN family flagellar motor C-terminal domain-containing protein [Thermoguttaceae bacterium]
MPELSSNIQDTVLAACQAGADEAAAAFGRAFDAQFKLGVGSASAVSLAALPEELKAPGLAMVFIVGQAAAVLALPETTGLLPDWYAAPDPTGQSKLSTLAQELGMNLLPEDFAPEDQKTSRVDNLAEALTRAELADDGVSIPLTLGREDGQEGAALLLWPVAKPGDVLAPASVDGAAAAAEEDETKEKEISDGTSAKSSPQAKADPIGPKCAKREFPPYTKSLLRVKLPLSVTLAEKKLPLSSVLELGPGQIIQFNKSCDEMLELEIGNSKIASGVAVKVGDKFGLRLTSILLPGERFRTFTPDNKGSLRAG